MNLIRKAALFSAVAVASSSCVAVAQYNHDDRHDGHGHYVRHNDWRQGGHIGHDDWNRGERVDYRRYHLNAPPRGYEWRQVDGNYVLAAAATGLIASVIVASTVH